MIASTLHESEFTEVMNRFEAPRPKTMNLGTD